MKTTRKAFSAIELVLIVAILCLVLAVSFPAIVKMREKSHHNEVAANIEMVIAAGKKYNDDKHTGNVDYKTLVDNRYIIPVTPVMGESYDDIIIHTVGGAAEVSTPMGDKISVEYGKASAATTETPPPAEPEKAE